MKKIALVVALTLSLPVVADETCGAVGDLAKTMITLKYKNFAMSKMMNVVENEPYAKGILIRAFEEPTYNTDENKLSHINKFTNDEYLRCVKAKDASK